EPHQLEAVAGIEAVFQNGEFLAKKQCNGLRFAEGLRGADGNARYRTIDAEERECELTYTFAAPFQILLERSSKQKQHLFYILQQADGFPKPALHRKRRNGQTWRDNLFKDTKGLIESRDQQAPESAGEWSPWCAEQGADTAQSHTFKLALDLRPNPESGKWHGRQCIVFPAGRHVHERSVTEPCCRPCHAWSGGKARPRVKTLYSESPQDFPQQGVFTAEQMGAAA